MRQERIKQKMEKEAKMRVEIMRNASEYINEFYEERGRRQGNKAGKIEIKKEMLKRNML